MLVTKLFLPSRSCHRDSATGHSLRFAFLGGGCIFPLLRVPLIFDIARRRTFELRSLHVVFPPRTPSCGRTRPLTHCHPCLNTHSLGEHLFPHRRLLEVMCWVPPRAGDPGLDGKTAGLFKAVGGCYVNSSVLYLVLPPR